MIIKTRILYLASLLILVMTQVVCAGQPIVIKDVFTQPKVDVKKYKRIVVSEFTPNPLVKKNLNMTDIIEDELNKSGYEVVGGGELNSILESLGHSGEELTSPEILIKAAQELKAEAIIRGEVRTYRVKENDEYVPFVTPDLIMAVSGKTYQCDIDLTVEIREAQEGKTVRSSSISCTKKKGRPEKLIRNMIRDYLSEM